nr:MAG TPA: hypothetical protein [Caudoviricetes sp.]
MSFRPTISLLPVRSFLCPLLCRFVVFAWFNRTLCAPRCLRSFWGIAPQFG